jgi:membrane-associated phospholipid phosphatase
MRGRAVGLPAVWLLLLVAVQGVSFLALWRFAVTTEHGQLLDTIALKGNSIGQDRIEGLVDRVLNAMSAVSLVAATATVGFIALVRRGLWLAFVATLLVVGANLTTQVLKYVITRPDLGIDPERAAAGNSLPSGHTAVAASVAVAFLLVLPSKVRAWWAVLGAGYTALAGVATMSAGWHRPSDAVASLLVVGAWAALAGLLLIAGQRRDASLQPSDAHWFTTAALTIVGVALLVAAWVAVDWTNAVLRTPVDDLNRGRVFIAYAGSAAGISGVACLIFAAVLATAHQVVPRRAAVSGGPVVTAR